MHVWWASDLVRDLSQVILCLTELMLVVLWTRHFFCLGWGEGNSLLHFARCIPISDLAFARTAAAVSVAEREVQSALSVVVAIGTFCGRVTAEVCLLPAKA